MIQNDHDGEFTFWEIDRYVKHHFRETRRRQKRRQALENGYESRDERQYLPTKWRATTTERITFASAMFVAAVAAPCVVMGASFVRIEQTARDVWVQVPALR